MPSPEANQLSRQHQAELAAAGGVVAQRVGEVAAAAPVPELAAVDAWWAAVRPELLAVTAAGFAATATLGVRWMRQHAALEGVPVEPVRAVWSTARAEASLHATGPAEFKTHIAAGGSPAQARAAMATTMSGSAQRLALAGERDTVAATVRDSDVIVGWRRQVDADPCAWCAMLASRGAVYKSEASAGGAGGIQYHDHDQCIAVPLYEREQEPPEVELLYEQWLRVTAGRSGKAAIREWRRWWDENRGDVDLGAAEPTGGLERERATAVTGEDALRAARFGLGRRSRPSEFTPDMSRAVNAYTGAEYNAVNRHLRGQPLPFGYEPADVLSIIGGVDAAMAGSRLDADVVTYRGISDARNLFGDRVDGDLTGLGWREDAYLSTSAAQRRARGFAGAVNPAFENAPMVMRITAPRGTPAVEASGMQLEAELLLDRGLTLRVVRDHGVSPDGVRHVDVEVVAGG